MTTRVIRFRFACLLRSLADKLDPPGFEWGVEYGQIADWAKVDVQETTRWRS